jgi:ZIP family zinc transporter
MILSRSALVWIRADPVVRVDDVIEALGWGSLAASSLIVGAILGLARSWPHQVVGIVLAFGAGALISAVSFDLAQEGTQLGGGDSVAIGLAAGALTYYLADRLLERLGGPRHPRTKAAAASNGTNAGPALALGAFLDGIPEQMVLGIGLATGEGVSVGLLVAIFISNLPEAIGSASAMRESGTSRQMIAVLWAGVSAICAIATVAGYGLASSASGDLQAVIDGFAAGALLVMLIDSMIPEAAEKAGRVAGLATVLGFAVAAGLSGIG